MFGFIGAAQIHMRKAVAFVARRIQSASEPGDGFIDVALLQQIGADIVVGISKIRIHFDRQMAFRDRFFTR